jgi:hypothetical protein
MKKGITPYIILIVAGLIILYFIGTRRSPFGGNNSDFAVSRGTMITGIDLIQGKKKIILRKEGERWTLNKSLEVRNSAIQLITKTLSEMAIKSPVAPEKFRDDIIAKEVDPVRVNVYEKRRLVRSFYVYKTESNIYGNIMRMRPSSKPFIVYIPGFEDNIGSHFVVNELFWQPFSVFRLLPSQIESVDFKNFKEPDESFLIKRSGDYFVLSDSSRKNISCDTAKVKRYISYYVSVAFETRAFDMKDDEKKNIESSVPLYIITVRKSDGGTVRLTTWEKWNTVNGEKRRDTDRVWGRTDEGNGIFIMRYFDLDPIIKKKSYFFGG